MNKNTVDFKNCLKNKKLIPVAEAKNLVAKELAESLVDLIAAKENVKSGTNSKWATIQAYYAMFHVAKALVYSRGYRERSHWCLSVAIEEFFGKTGLMEMKLVRYLEQAMSLREDADYAAEYSQEGAIQILAKAEEFIQKAQEILE